MAQKRPGKPRRRTAKTKRGRTTAPAALVFFAGAAVALIALFFAYAFYYLPHQGHKPQVTAQAPLNAPASPPQGQTPPPAAQAQSSGASQPQNQAAVPATPPQAPEAEAQTAARPAPEKPAGRLAIVIDDLGGSLDQAQEIIALGLPVTFSILADQPHASDVDALAAKAGQEVILNQPMEARGQAQRTPGTLSPGMSVPETAALLDAHLAKLPHAVGISSNKGSEATEDHALMAAVMAHLKDRRLFFLDSLTTPKSVAGQEAAREGVPALARTVFLDNERGQQAALFMLAEAERDARAKGRAVAICRPYPETIAALDAWKLRRDKGVQLVTLGRLLKGN